MPKTPTREAANHLRAWREHRGLSQEQLAELVDTKGNVISLLESGERGLSDKWLRRLAPALGVSAGWLMDYSPEDVSEADEMVRDLMGLDKGSRAQVRDIIQTFSKRRATR